MAQRVKNPSAMQETQEMWVRSLGWEDPWKRKWQPTPVFLPGESHGQRRLAGFSPRGCKESDTTERLHFHFSLSCLNLNCSHRKKEMIIIELDRGVSSVY